VLEVKGADMGFIADPRVEDTGSASKVRHPHPLPLLYTRARKPGDLGFSK
jgi:hypothetical protein